MITSANDPRINKILQLVSKLTARHCGKPIERVGNDDIEHIIESLTVLVEQSNLWGEQKEGNEATPAMETDLTEYTRVQEKMRLYSFTLERMTDGVQWIDRNARIVDVNEAACRMLGYSREELVGMTLTDIDPVFDLSDLDAVWEIVKGGPPPLETWHKKKDGTLIPVEIQGNLLAFEDKEFNCAFVRDITQRKQAEETLRQNEARYRTLVESQVDLFSRYLPDTNLTYVNDAYCQFYGKTRDELIGQSYLTMVAPGFRELSLEETRRLSREPRLLSGEYLNYAADGKAYWIHWIIQPILNEQGQVVEFQAVGRDVSQLKQAEAALRESEFFLQKSQEVARIGSYYLEVKAGQWISSPMLDEILGIDDQFLKDVEGWITLVHPDHQEEIRQYLSEHVLENQNRFEKEYRIIRHSDQQERWIYGLGELEFDDQGTPVRIIGTLQDITAQKLAEEALRLSNFALERTSDAVYWINLTTIVDVNEAACRMLGYSRDEFRGMSVTKINPTMSEIEMVNAWEYVKSQGSITFETWHQTKDGRRIPVELMANYIVFEGKEFNCCFARDITERRQTEQSLLLANFAVETVSDAVYWVDKDANIVNVNDAACRMVGYSREEFAGMSIDELDPVMPLNEVVTLWNQTKEKGTLKFETYHKTKEGRVFPVEIVASHIAYEGKEFSCCFVRDITERKQAEEDIRKLNEELEQRVIERTRELERANEEIRHFAYIVSHDLRAPLVNLKGFSAELRSGLTVIETDLSDVLPLIDAAKRDRMINILQEDIPESLRFIESSVDNMDTFTKAILKLSRFGRLHLDLVEVDVKSLVEKTLASLSYQISQQKIQVTVGDLPVIVADLVSIEQIFSNILTNAVNYLDPDRPGKIDIRAEQLDDVVAFHIQDNGRGIAQADFDKVFAPFRRAGQQNMPGEGMGLAYVQTLVRRHGGRIWFDSEPGIGTTFTFTISRNIKNITADT